MNWCQRDGGKRTKKQGVSRNLKTELEHFLDGHGQESDGRAGSDPVAAGLWARGAQITQDGSSQQHDGDRCRDRDQQSAFGEHLQVVVVRLREMTAWVAPLIKQHGS